MFGLKKYKGEAMFNWNLINRHSINRHSVLSAFTLLSRIPLPKFDYTPNCIWAYPLVGVFLGTVYALVYTVSIWIGFSPAVAVVFMLIKMLFLTGAVHLDGLADTADGLWGGNTREHRLQIMKDSTLGTYGTSALIIAFLLYFSILLDLSKNPQFLAIVITISVISRMGMGILQIKTPYAKSDGTLAQTGNLKDTDKQQNMLVLCVVSVLLSIVFMGFFDSIFLVLCVGIGVYILRAYFIQKIGGITGDTLGATQVILEIALLSIYSILL